MNKPTIIIIIAIVIIGAGVGIYFATRETETVNTNTNQNTNQGVVSNTDQANTNTRQENTYQGEDFSILKPLGWTQSQLPGALVSFHKADEVHPEGSAAAKINFKSYIAVSFDTIQSERIDEINKTVVDQVVTTIPSAQITEESDEEIDGQAAKFNVMTMTQQEVDYTVFLAVILKGDKYYTVSGNTTTDLWGAYKDLFYTTARSLEFKN